MKYELFQSIFDRAARRHGGNTRLNTLLDRPFSSLELRQHSDDRWLSAFSQKIFQSGINWQVVRNKWPDFETVFFAFDVEKMLLIHDEMWQEKAKDTRIIRNFGKVMTIRENALMINECQTSHGSFANFVAQWPNEDIIGLWAYLKKHGARLGGNTGPYTLRAMGKDTFMLTKDVEGYLRHHEIITTGRDTQTAWKAAQNAFNHWHKESGRSYTEISQCIALSVN
ncbi:DNA-3-methyladenine glycosylase I [Marinomonas sp. IMCC 4694]|uniref:DNA-3-methyladenine glycosylase I n=1 Tax=Marinomonas sp. IMCC 4694 TaxID=2605432 RepID=UPI0011E779B7|nr:DNA-3-methyladenine glycosylase I [Marinomonas sp. IMCC 4694]TYL48186.1 DNA-3-methyladenine glycosylase I [Marinomonas sp. IMCC 4694]